MGFLDKMKDVAGKAADQAKHATAVGKEKMEDAKLKKKIDTLCEEIGQLIVAQKRGEAPADIDAQIDAKVAEIGELEKQIDENNVAKPDAEDAATEDAATEDAATEDAATEDAATKDEAAAS